MREDVLTRIMANAEYHAAMAEHFAALKERKDGNGRERATMDDTHPLESVDVSASVEDLVKLIEMHAGAAQMLQELIANEKPQNILAERANPPVLRKPGLPMRNGSPRIH